MNEDEMWERAEARAAAYRAAWDLARVDGATLEQAILSLPGLADTSVIMKTLAGTGAQA